MLAKLDLSQYCMSFMQLALMLKKMSYKLCFWLMEMGSEAPWMQTFMRQLFRRPKNKHSSSNPEVLCFLLALLKEISRASVGNMKAQRGFLGGLFSPSQREQHDHKNPVLLACLPSVFFNMSVVLNDPGSACLRV